jgi:chromosome segregation ATPase
MFGWFKKSENEEIKKYQKDNVTLMTKISELQAALTREVQSTVSFNKQLAFAEEQIKDGNKKIEELEKQLAELQAEKSKKVTYAQARKALTKAKLKALRQSLENIPSGAQGFSGSVSVYDKKTKKLSVIELKSKEQALEILSKAEKGNVDIVI